MIAVSFPIFFIFLGGFLQVHDQEITEFVNFTFSVNSESLRMLFAWWFSLIYKRCLDIQDYIAPLNLIVFFVLSHQSFTYFFSLGLFFLTELSGLPPDIISRLIPEHARRQNLFMALDA